MAHSRWLLIFNGVYGKKMAGPAVRYLELAKQVSRQGDEVTLTFRQVDSENVPGNLAFIPVNSIVKVIAAMWRADVMLLHGGRPLLIVAAALFSVFTKKKVILDAYAPHWIELSETRLSERGVNGLKRALKICYNITRMLFALTAFDAAIVANKRQSDLLRGMLSPTSGVLHFHKIRPIEFATELPVERKDRNRLLDALKKTGKEITEPNAFIVGWLGGLWEWFDIEFLLGALERAILENPEIYCVFFGANEDFERSVIRSVRSTAIKNFVFVRWVDYSDRLQIWSGLDMALVWGGTGIENEYSSRTRNFDCLAAGVPILQNDDDTWGPIIRRERVGAVCAPQSLASTLVRLSRSPRLVRAFAERALRLAPAFSWERFYENVKTLSTVRKERMGLKLFLIVPMMVIVPMSVISLFVVHLCVGGSATREK